MPETKVPGARILDNYQMINFERKKNNTYMRVSNLQNLPTELVEQIMKRGEKVPDECVTTIVKSKEEIERILGSLTKDQQRIAKFRYPGLFGNRNRPARINRIARELGIDGSAVDRELEIVNEAIGLAQN
jgi:hypothetical protein